MSSGSILVVDDDADIREVTTIALESYGYRVVSAPDGEQALHLLRRDSTIVLVLLDLMMPIMDGPTFMKKLMADTSLSPVSVIVLSGDSAARQKAVDIAADAFLPKPVELSSLLDFVRRFVDRSSERVRARLASSSST